MWTSSELAKKKYAEFDEKLKRTVFVSKLPPLVTTATIETVLGQFGTVVNVEFHPNHYTLLHSQCALVEMETEKQVTAIVADMSIYPFMVTGMPRPVTAQAVTLEMFAGLPSWQK